MNRTTLSAVFCAVSLAASAAFAADLSAAQIAEKNVAARGGLEAWRAVNTLTMSGEMDAGGKQDTKLPFVFSLKRPHKSRLEIRFQNQTAVQTYDGTQGWKLRPFLGRNDADPFMADEAKSAAAADELDGPLVDYARKGENGSGGSERESSDHVLLTGRLSTEGKKMIERQEPYESRDSRTDLWGPRGEIPLGYPTIRHNFCRQTAL